MASLVSIRERINVQRDKAQRAKEEREQLLKERAQRIKSTAPVSKEPVAGGHLGSSHRVGPTSTVREPQRKPELTHTLNAEQVVEQFQNELMRASAWSRILPATQFQKDNSVDQRVREREMVIHTKVMKEEARKEKMERDNQEEHRAMTILRSNVDFAPAEEAVEASSGRSGVLRAADDLPLQQALHEMEVFVACGGVLGAD